LLNALKKALQVLCAFIYNKRPETNTESIDSFNVLWKCPDNKQLPVTAMFEAKQPAYFTLF